MRALLAGLLLLLASAAAADERILSFHSDIVINADATIDVTETIRVRAEGQRIRRGIYRSLPTLYKDKLGNEHTVSIEPQSVQRNGRREDWHVRTPRDAIVTYFGDSDRFIDSGEHEYVFRYRAYRMLGFFEEYDELYWNVSGFEWDFPIDRASASVSFSFDVNAADLVVDAYTGAFGEQGRDYGVELDEGPVVRFESNSPLSPANGLTIVVAWPKGLVGAPSGIQRFIWLLNDNRALLVALIGTLLLLAYYIPVWHHFGRDPEEGLIVTRYEPPASYSPASLRYVRQMHYDGKVMTAAIVNLAVKGYLDITKDDDEHSLKRRRPASDAPPLAAGERELYEALFADGESIELDNANHKVIGAARAAHKKSLQADYSGRYFRINGLLNVPAAFIAIATAVLTFSQSATVTPVAIGVVIANFLIMVLFAILMRQHTPRGRKLLDEIGGFRDYLDVAEKDELELRNPPQRTPELFERYLPYALALGVDQRWSERFAAVLAEASVGPDGYQPHWYHGDWNSSVSLSSDLSGSFNQAVSHSASPPGSSSGSGGGGFSGGGGGGGGGGGW